MTKTIYKCPKCGAELQQGEYYYDTDSDTMRVECCPECDCEDEKCAEEEVEDTQVHFAIQCDKSMMVQTLRELAQELESNGEFDELETAYYMATMTEEE